MWTTLSASTWAPGVAYRPCRQLTGVGWTAGGSKPAACTQCRRPRTKLAELARVEHARSAYRARGGADGVGCIDPALCTLLGAAAANNRRAGHQQECGERTVCIRDRAQIGRADEPRARQ